MPYKFDDEILTSRRRQRMAALAGMIRAQLDLENELDRDRPRTALSAVANLTLLVAEEMLAELEPPRVHAVEGGSPLVGDYPD